MFNDLVINILMNFCNLPREKEHDLERRYELLNRELRAMLAIEGMEYFEREIFFLLFVISVTTFICERILLADIIEHVGEMPRNVAHVSFFGTLPPTPSFFLSFCLFKCVVLFFDMLF